MASPTLAVRLGILAGVIFGAVAIIAFALAILFFIGLRAVPPASLAIGVLVLITVAAAIALTVVFGPALIVAGIMMVVVFIVASLAISPSIGVVSALLFLLLLGLVVIVMGTPIGIPIWLLAAAILFLPVVALLAGLFGPGGALMVIAVLGYIVLGLVVLWLALHVHRMPIGLLGLGGLTWMPAIPLPTVPDFIDAVVKLKQKEAQRQIPIDAMTNVFELGAGTPRARKDDARTFLFGGIGRDDASAKQYSLDDPAQFDMCWTTYEQIDTRAAALSTGVPASATTPAVSGFRDALTSHIVATSMFWRNISRYWNPFGVLPIRAVTSADVSRLSGLFGSHWDDPSMQAMIRGGTLFELDMTIFEAMDPPTASSSTRFSPSTLTLFELDTTDAAAPAFNPFLIRVSDGRNMQVYSRQPASIGSGPMTPGQSAWIYALQAVKASTTCWGIWLGHVYRYHIVTTAMQMTMYQRLPSLHPVRQILGRQSKYTIGFDAVLLTVWSFPPPTSCGTSIEFLQLIDAFARGRLFGVDNPETALSTTPPGVTPPGQGLPMPTFSNPDFWAGDIDLRVFVPVLQAAARASGTDLIADEIIAKFRPQTPTLLGAYGGADDPRLADELVTVLNAVVRDSSITPTLIAAAATLGITLHPDTTAEITANTRPAFINRMILTDAYTSLSIMQWNRYPVAHYVVSIYRIVSRYVAALMAAVYPTGATTPVDPATQAWLDASRVEGNIQGLPPGPNNVGQLTGILTSLIYRITAHGMARLAPVGNPGLIWVGNFPPCLEDSRLPDPTNPAGTTPPGPLTTEQLLTFLPKTGTIGEMVSFIFSFGFTDNFEPLIPVVSANTTGLTNYEVFPFHFMPPACDAALAAFRTEMIGFMRHFIADQNRQNFPAVMNFSATAQQIHQWELSIEQ